MKKMTDTTEENSAKAAEDIGEAVNPDAVADSLGKIGGGGNVFIAAAEAAQAAAPGLAGSVASGGSGFAGAVSASSSGISAGGAVGGTGADPVLQAIDQKISNIIQIMSNPSAAGGGLVVDT